MISGANMNSYKRLQVYQDGINFVTSIYKNTEKYPKEERFGLVSQLRRAAVSIPSNIAEGARRKSTKEFIQFLYVSYGSCAEIETQLEISKNLGYLMENDIESITRELENISKMLNGLITSLRRKKTNHQSLTTTH